MGFEDLKLIEKAIEAAYKKSDFDANGTIDAKEAYIALLLVYDKVNKLEEIPKMTCLATLVKGDSAFYAHCMTQAPFHLKPLKFKEFKVYCKKVDVKGDELSQQEFKKLVKMVIGGDTGTWRRSLWFRTIWHAALELFIFASLAEVIAKAAQDAELPWVSAAAVAVLLKVGYKVAAMLVNKSLMDDDA